MKKNFLFMIMIFLMMNISGTCVPGSFSASVEKIRVMPEGERAKAVGQLLEQFPVSPVIENDTVFTVYWFGKAEKVDVAGDLQHGWSRPDELEMIICGKKSLFYRTYAVPSDGRFDYQFIVDGKYITDPRNPVITPSGFGPHSQVAMPGFRSDPVMLERPGVPKGRVDTMTFIPKNKNLLSRKIKIYSPAGSHGKMPVMVVYDGIEAIDFMNYRNVMDNLVADRKIRPSVVVFVAPGDRYRETVQEFTEAFVNALCDELLPMISEKYDLSPDPADHAISGISAGGHLALITVLMRPDAFLCAAGQSSSMTNELKNQVDLLIEKNPRPAYKLYFDVGRYDLEDPGMPDNSMLGFNRKLDEYLTSNDIPHVYHEFNDGHSWANWRERTAEILVLFFGK